MQNITKLT